MKTPQEQPGTKPNRTLEYKKEIESRLGTIVFIDLGVPGLLVGGKNQFLKGKLEESGGECGYYSIRIGRNIDGESVDIDFAPNEVARLKTMGERFEIYLSKV